eukprot:scaffold73103_cov32-Tisochrysis_lutea.AAC.1
MHPHPWWVLGLLEASPAVVALAPAVLASGAPPRLRVPVVAPLDARALTFRRYQHRRRRRRRRPRGRWPLRLPPRCPSHRRRARVRGDHR